MSGNDGGWLLPETVDPSTLSFCITIPNETNHVRAFFGALQSLAEWWNWQRDEEHKATLVAQVWRRVANQAYVDFLTQSCNEGAMLRQNPDDNCQLEQSFDDGETWSLAFDFGLCEPLWAKTIRRAVDIMLNTQRDGASSPIEININAPITTWIFSEGDTDAEVDIRLQALCWASGRFVDMLADLAIGVIQNEIDQINLAEAVLGIAAVIAGVLGAPVFSAIGIAIGVAMLEQREAMVSGDVAILEDGDIRELLTCAMFQNLQSKPVSPFSLSNVFDQELACLTADEERAFEIMQGVTSNPNAINDLYTGFVDLIGDARSAYLSGLLGASCVCSTRSWEYCLPLSEWINYQQNVEPYTINCIGSVGKTPSIATIGEFTGEPVWLPDETGDGFLAMSAVIQIYVPSGTTVEYVGWEWLVASGNSDTWAKKIDVNNTCDAWTTFPPAEINVSSLSISGEMMTITIAMQNSGGTSNPLMVGNIRLTGTGVPLFGVCDNC